MFQHSCINMEVITNNRSSCYQESDILLRRAQLQYKNKEITWIEAMACFEEQHGECLLKNGRDANGAFNAALRIYRWISEESDYLCSVYQKEANQYRKEIYSRMDSLENKWEAYKCVSKRETEAVLAGILYRLRISSSLRYPDKDIQKTLYLLSYDTDIVSKALPLIINTIHEFIINNLIEKEALRTLYNILNKKAIAQGEEVAQFWYSNEWSKLHPLITEAIQLQALIFLLLEQTGEEEEDMQIIAARICRYLSRYPSAYSELLKNKSYTHLTGENRLNGRIQWSNLCNFDEKLFLEQVIMIRVDEQPCPAYEPDNKWIQCSNTTNTLTLDNDGFTLSSLFPHINHTWKGRKDRATVLNNRLFMTSFSKLPYTFDSCKNIKDFRLYWKQLAEDYPMSQQWDNSQVKISVLPEKNETIEAAEKEIIFSTSENTLPVNDQDLNIRILFIDEENLSIHTEVIDEPFRGIKARLPFAYINPCYSKIPGFASLFTVNEIFRTKVKEINKGEVILSLIKDFNEFIYPVCVRQKGLTSKIVEIRDGKVWWLLSSGATAITNIIPYKKYKVGDIYKVEYAGLLPDKLKNNINVQAHIAQSDENDFNQTVLDNIRDFFLFLTKEGLKTKNDLHDLKTKNNPFFVALQNLSLKETGDSLVEVKTQETPETEDKEKKIALSNPTLNAKLVQELIYCMDSLTSNIDNPCEQFNTYNILRFLCHFIGNKELATYYSLCADYIYNVDVLTTEPFQDRFSKGNIQKFSLLLTRMESLKIKRYSNTLGLCKQVIQVLQALFDTNSLSLLQSFIQSENRTVSELARYFSITQFLKENDTALQQLIYKNINLLLGFKEPEKKVKSYVPVYFGHEGVEKEFKTSAFIHADKNAAEEQCVVLARVIASFMNTDGGTLYIGVNDLGYLNGLAQEFKFTHNDSDVYLRTVNRNIIRQLGEADNCNRYQEYMRCRLYEYEDGRMVLAFRVSPINEVVKVKDVVYTRSASSNIVKLEQNVNEFIKKRREQKLNFTPLKPEFPTLFSSERNEYIFNTIPLRPSYPEQTEEQIPCIEPVYTTKKKSAKPEKESILTTFTIKTSSLRSNPLQKKAEHGYMPNHLFVSVFADGKVAYSASPKIGIWGGKKGKVIFSYKPEDKEDLMVAVFNNGEVGISNLKKGMSQPNMPIAFVNHIDSLFFLSPAHKTDYLLLLSEKEGEKRYRIISLQDFEKSMSIQPKNTLILEPDKGTFIFAEILSPSHLRAINDDKTSLFDFDQYNAGRYWEHSVYRQGVEVICKLCALPF